MNAVIPLGVISVYIPLELRFLVDNRVDRHRYLCQCNGCGFQKKWKEHYKFDITLATSILFKQESSFRGSVETVGIFKSKDNDQFQVIILFLPPSFFYRL